MANHHLHYILSLCKQIHASGKTPTVGLIRAKADRKLTVPSVISALKHWQETPETPIDIEPSHIEQEHATLEDRVLSLEREVAALKDAINALLARRD